MRRPADPTYALVDDLIETDPLVLGSHLDVSEAAAAMTASGAGRAAMVDGPRIAVLTDAHIRTWVAAGQPPVSAVSLADHHQPTVPVGTSSAEAIITMLDRDASCVVVVEPGGGLRGIVTDRDFLVSPTTAGVTLHQQLRRATSLDELSRRAVRLPVALRDVTRRGLATSRVIAVHSALVDTVVRRTIELVLARHDGLDAADFTWLALGSNGRREAVLSSDVDAAVAFGDHVDADQVDDYRAVMGEIVAELARSGLTSDSHGATPAHRLFARTHREWRAAAHRWLAEPTANKGAVLISLLVDGRPVHGDPGPTILAEVVTELRRNPSTLRVLLDQALQSRARLRTTRTLLTRRQEPFDIKENALAPIANLARWAALSSGSPALSTVERLRTSAGSIMLPAEEATTLIEIFEVLQRLRLRHQLAQLDAGEPASDVVSVDRLSPIDRAVIGQAVREISAVQRRAANLSASAPAGAWLEAGR